MKFTILVVHQNDILIFVYLDRTITEYMKITMLF